MRIKPLSRAIAFLIGTSACAASVQATDWLQFGYDQAHSGNNTAEKGYSTAGNSLAFSANLLSVADSAPVFASGILSTTDDVSHTTAVRDLLFVGAVDGTLYTLDAKNGSKVWSQKPAAIDNANGGFSAGGPTGSPAIDAAKQFVYAYGLDGKIHKYAIGTGVESKGVGDPTWPQVATLKPGVEKAGGGLSIATTSMGTFLYSVTDGYNGDGGDYQGHLTAINLGTGAQKVFNSLCSNMFVHLTYSSGANPCSSAQNGIWGRPGAVYNPATDRVYITTGNGPYDPANLKWGDSVLALNPDGSGSAAGYPIDAYTPTTANGLQGSDADLGDTSIVILPTPANSNVAHIGLQGGKDGCVRLLNLGLLNGQYDQLNSTTKLPIQGGELQTFDLPGLPAGTATYCTSGSANAGHNRSTFKPQPAVWINPADSSIWIFIAHNSGLASYTLGIDGGNNPTLTAQWTSTHSGTSPVVANNTLYDAASNNLYALNPTTGTQIWNATAIGSIHWQSLILVNGHLYVVDSASKLWSYALDGIFKNGFN
jgi:outer membrane protein assembly factor BamB